MFKVLFIFGICLISHVTYVNSSTCGQLGREIKAYEEEIQTLKTALEEHTLKRCEDVVKCDVLDVVKIEDVDVDVGDECNISTTCSTCLSENRNPACGWCVLRHKCSLSVNCPENQTDSEFWIKTSDRCPQIRDVTPPYIPAHKTETFLVTISHLPKYNGTFLCSFDVRGQNFITNGIKVDRGIKCPSPIAYKLPMVPMTEIYATVKLSIRAFNDSDIVTTSNLTLFDCNNYRTCSECASSSYPCAWHTDDQRCNYGLYDIFMSDTIIFSKSVTRPASTRRGAAYCPRLSFNNKVGNEVLISSETNKIITLKIHNLMYFHEQAKFTCKFLDYEEVMGQLLGDVLYCDEVNFRILDWKPVNNYTLSVFWNDTYQLEPKNLHVVVYDCNVLAHSCAECLELPLRYKCGWCKESQSCVVEGKCENSVWLNNTSTCDSPKIKQIFPTAGMFAKKTNITILGENLARKFEDIVSVSLIDKKGDKITDCVPYDYVKHNSIMCQVDGAKMLRPSGYVKVVLLGDHVATSEREFILVEPAVLSFQPKQGLASSKTILTISGSDLDAGNVVKVYIGNTPCSILSRNHNRIRCLSFPVLNQNHTQRSAVRVIFDGVKIQSNCYFSHVADPSIYSVRGLDSKSPEGTMSGGNLVVVEGINFLNVLNPYFYVTVDGVEYIEECAVISNTLMECLSPRIPADVLSFCGEQWFHFLPYGFGMDGAEIMEDITQKVDFLMYAVHPDPYLLPFDVERNIWTLRSTADPLIIRGRYLTTIFEEKDYLVKVGNKICQVEEIEWNLLTCKLPAMSGETYNENQPPKVHVEIRGRFKYFIGYLRIEDDSSW